MKTIRICLFALLILALAVATVSALDSRYIPDYFEECEDYDENPYQEQCTHIPESGYYINTSCGMSVLGYRMIQLSYDETPTFSCYYTGCSFDRCYLDYIHYGLY